MTSIQNISLYIPHIFANITSENVSKIFYTMEIGEVKHIDFVSKMNKSGKIYNTAYIHFHKWFNTITARNFQAKVLDNTKEARLMYDDPWYWIVLENKARKYLLGERKPCLVLETPFKVEKPNSVLDTDFKAEVDQSVNNSLSEEEITDLESDLDDEQKMAELEELMDQEEEYLISIDGRYVSVIEQENIALRAQVCQLQNAYNIANHGWYAESKKTEALSNALNNLNK
jgi:hypothetical protein